MSEQIAAQLTEPELAELVISSVEAFQYRDGPYLEREHCALARKLGYNEGRIARLWRDAADEACEQLARMRASLASVGARFDALRPKIEEVANDPNLGALFKKFEEAEAKPAYRRIASSDHVVNRAASSFLPATQPAADEEAKDTPKEKPEPEPDEEPEKSVVLHALPAIIPPQPPPTTWSDLLTVMNNQHAIIDNVGGKTVIASWEPSSLDPTRLMIAFQSKESLLLRYSNLVRR